MKQDYAVSTILSIPKIMSNFCDLEIVEPVNQDLNAFVIHCQTLKKAFKNEKSQLLTNICEYDMFDVRLKSHNNTYAIINVPGIAELRPSVWIGDTIYVWVATHYPTIQCMCSIIYIKNDDIIITFPTVNLQKHFMIDIKQIFKKFLFNIRFNPHLQSFKYIQYAINHIQTNQSNYEHILFPSFPSFPLNDEKIQDNQTIPNIRFINPLLNSEQKMAVQTIVKQISKPILPIFVIHGGPGGGKTMTLVESVLQTLQSNGDKPVLICTPSDYSADIIVDRLKQFGISNKKMFRLNMYYRHTSLINGIQSYCYFDQDTGMYSIYPKEKLQQFKVIICTCVTSVLLYKIGINKDFFQSIFFDEAAQSTEGEMYIPLLLASSRTKIILSGDHMQLPPIIHSVKAQKILSVSLQERLMHHSIYSNDEQHQNSLLLVKNYRAHPIFLQLTSDLFYKSLLQSASNLDETSSLTQWNQLPNKNNFPLLFDECIGEDVFEVEKCSFYNLIEASRIVSIIQNLLSQSNLAVSQSEICVITPYRLQVMKLRQLLRLQGLGAIHVDDVYAMQGKEQRIVLISTVLSKTMGDYNKVSKTNLLSNAKLFNVALSRAKCLTIVVGNPYVLQQYTHWNSLMLYCLKNQSYKGCHVPLAMHSLAGQASVPILYNDVDVS